MAVAMKPKKTAQDLSKDQTDLAEVFRRGKFQVLETATVMAWFVRSRRVTVLIYRVQADAVEVAGVVELIGSPRVWRVLVFSNAGDARVVEDEEPLISSAEIQQMRQNCLQ